MRSACCPSEWGKLLRILHAFSIVGLEAVLDDLVCRSVVGQSTHGAGYDRHGVASSSLSTRYKYANFMTTVAQAFN